MEVSIERIMQDVEKYGRIGENALGGVSRTVFSEEDFIARNLFATNLKNMGLKVLTDGAANIWGKYPGNKSQSGSIVIGSHLDTVPNGGKYDGALGVLVAKEIIQTLIDNEVTLNHDLEIVSFTGEEANEFNLSTMGSRIFTGKLTKEAIKNITNSNGVQLENLLLRGGGGIHLFDDLKLKRKEKKVFLELHVEQGKRLENEGIPLGIVDTIVGIYRDKVTVYGESNHAGTTMMNDRFDALNAASEMVLAVEKVAKSMNSNAVATVGKFDVSPNAANIVPGKIDFILEVRSGNPNEREIIVDSIQKAWEVIIKNRDIDVNIENILNQKEVYMDEDILKSLIDTTQQLNVPYTQFSSMAGHDATHMAEITKSAMIFVKSPNGKSHCPDEYSKPEDIKKSSDVLLNAILHIDKVLN